MQFKFTVALAAFASISQAESSWFESLRMLNEELEDSSIVTVEEPVKIPYYERAQNVDEVGWFRGSTYQGKTRQDKMTDLWGKVIEDTSGPKAFMWKHFDEAFIQKSPHALCQRADEVQKGRKKVQHTQGVVAKVKYVAEPNNGLSGILGSGSDTALLRFSESMYLHEESAGLTPSVAVKFLRDGMKSANILAQPSFKNSGSWNFMKEPFKTRVEMFDPAVDKIEVATIEKKLLGGSNNPYLVAVRESFEYNQDGSEVPAEEIGWIPYQVEFESEHYQFSDTRTGTPWYEQLMSITADPERPLLTVYALTAPLQLNGERVKIGSIELDSQLTTSVFGDERLYFQHLRGPQDKKLYKKEWKQFDFKRTEEHTSWGRWAPATWPTTNEEAKYKYMEQERLFGCPFAWLLGIHTEEDLINANL